MLHSPLRTRDLKGYHLNDASPVNPNELPRRAVLLAQHTERIRTHLGIKETPPAPPKPEPKASIPKPVKLKPIKIIPDTKRCNKCGEVRSLYEFNLKRPDKYWRRSVCRICSSAYRQSRRLKQRSNNAEA